MSKQPEKNFLEALENNHKRCITRIKEAIDVDAQPDKEYKAAATLCKFIFDYKEKYALLEHPEEHGRFYECAHDFETLCDCIYHALTDDGDIALAQFNKNQPTIVFRCKWDITPDDFLSESDKALQQRFQQFTSLRGMSVDTKNVVKFFDTVEEFIQAVYSYEVESAERYEKVQTFVKTLKSNESKSADIT